MLWRLLRFLNPSATGSLVVSRDQSWLSNDQLPPLETVTEERSSSLLALPVIQTAAGPSSSGVSNPQGTQEHIHENHPEGEERSHSLLSELPVPQQTNEELLKLGVASAPTALENGRISPSSPEARRMIAEIRRYFSIPDHVPVSEVPLNITLAMEQGFTSNIIRAPEKWGRRFCNDRPYGLNISQEQSQTRDKIAEWISTIDGPGPESEGASSPAIKEETLIPRPSTPRHGLDADHEYLNWAEHFALQVEEEVSPVDENSDYFPDSGETSPSEEHDFDARERAFDAEFMNQSAAVTTPQVRLYNRMIRPTVSERELDHRPKVPSTLRREIVIVNLEV